MEMIGEYMGLMELLNLIWMELVMAVLAAVFYLALSGKRVPPPVIRNEQKLGRKNTHSTHVRHGGSKSCVARGMSSRTGALHRATPHTDGTADAKYEKKGPLINDRSDGSCSDSDRSTDCPSILEAGSESSVDDVFDVSSQAWAIKQFGKAGNLAAAVGVYERVKRHGHVGNSFVFNSLLDACIECGAMEKAEEYFKWAQCRSFGTVVTYNTMMKGYLAQKQVAQAEALLRELATRGMAATQASYHGLIQSRLQGGDREGAWKLLDEMIAQRLAPNSVTCAIMLKGVKPFSRDVLRVLQIVPSMSTPIDEVLFPLLVEACVALDRLDLLTSMHATFTKQGGPYSISMAVYGIMMKAYGKARQLDRVVKLWNEMKDQQIKLTSVTVGCAVEALVANGYPDRAWELIQELWSSQEQRGVLNAVIYSTIIKGYVIAKQPETVMRLYDEMRSRGIQPNAITYNTILNALAQCRAMDLAPSLLQEMHDADPRVEPDLITYSTVVKGYCAAGDLDKALELLKVMKLDARLKPDEVTYNSLLDGCAKQNRLEVALDLVNDMKESAVPVSNYTLSILVKLLGRCKRLDQAFETVDKLSCEYGFHVNLQVYTCLVQACFHNKQPSRALALHERMLNDKCALDEKAYTSIVRGCLQFRLLDKAVHIVRCAFGVAKGNEASPGIDSRTLEELKAALGPNTKCWSSLEAEIHFATRRKPSVFDRRIKPGFEPRSLASVSFDRRCHGRVL